MAYQKVEENLDSVEATKEFVDSLIQLQESNKINSRINYLRSRLGLSISPQVASRAIKSYSELYRKNPNLSHFRILAKMPQNQRDTLTQVNAAVPMSVLANASDSQFQRVVKDVIREQNEMLNEEFSPPAVLLLKRQAIRQFPNGQRVALYTDNKLNLTFTVPYDVTGRGLSAGRVIPGMMSEASADIKLQRAYEAEQMKSAASRARGEEILAQARAEYDRKKADSDLPFEPNATRPEMAPGKLPASFRHVRNLARRAMKAGIVAQTDQTADDLIAQHHDLHQHMAEENVAVLFASGEELIVSKALLEKIDDVYSNLTEENQTAMNDMVLESAEQFYRVVEFVESIEQ